MNHVKQLIKETKKYLTKYDYDKVIELCDKILEIEPESSFGLRYKAIAHYQSGNYQEGLEYYTKLDELYPDEDTKYTISYLNEKLENYEKALEFYDKNSKEKWIQSRRKRLLTKIKSYQQVIEEYNEKLKEIENMDKTQSNIKRRMFYLEEKAVFQYRNRTYDESVKSFKEALTLYHSIESELPYYYKVKVENWYKILEEFLDENNPAIDFFNEFFNFKNHNEIWSNKLNAEFSEYEDSIVYPDLLLELNPDNIELLQLIAKRYRYISYDYSLECLNKILEIDPQNTEAIEKMLEIYSHQYSKDKSLKLINQKLSIEDIRVNLLNQKIRILESMTLYDEALMVYDEYLSIENKDETINNKLTVFDKIRCMEKKSVELYLDNQLEESFALLKEVYTQFEEHKNSKTITANVDKWYTDILGNCIKLSIDDYEIFFKKYLTLDERTTVLWEEKIHFLLSSNHYGNPITYCDILLDKNRNNIKILLMKAYVYYSTEKLDNALEIYNKLIKLDDNNEAKNYKFNILIKHHQYKKAYELFKSMKVIYSIVNNKLYTLANKLLEKREYSESLEVYETIYERTYSFDTINIIKFLLIKTENTEKLHNCKYYMNWIDLINYKYESDKCPTCGKEMTPIIYGYPTPEAMKSADKGEIILGGCCVSYGDPTHYCRHCKKKVNMGTYRIDITDDDIDLSYYTISKIHWITEYIKKHPKNTIPEIEKEAHEMGINHQELTRFIEKLEEIKHLKRENNTLKLIE